MSVTIYAYRTLVWLSDQQQILPAGSVPEEILPPDEREATHQEMLQHGWLIDHEKRLAGGPEFALSIAGKRQARRGVSRYAVYSAAYEILAAIPQGRSGHLSRAKAAFTPSFRDPVLQRPFEDDEIEDAADLLQQHQQIQGAESHGEPLSHLEITPSGQSIRDEHYVPGLRPGSSVAETAPRTEFNTNISGGTFGAAQFGQNNTAHVENVSSAIHQQFRELRELTSSATVSEDKREELSGQIDELEEAATTGNLADFQTLKNGFMGGFANSLGDRAVSMLLVLPPMIAALGG